MAVAVVQSRGTSVASATSLALPFTSNNAAGNLLLYLSAAGNSSSTLNLAAATDSNTNTIVNALSAVNGAAAGAQVRADYVASSHSGANTATADTAGGGWDMNIQIYEISGCATASPLRDSGSTHSTAGSVSTGGTSTLSGDAVIAFFNDDTANVTLTADGSYTSSLLTANSGGGSCVLSEFKAASAGGTQTGTCGGNGTDNLTQLIVVFKAASAAFQPDEDYWIPPRPVQFDPNVTVF